ncbi:MAG TPA: hypothetical protein V6C95_08585 [Coleofasciculaceae cyanobacterium]
MLISTSHPKQNHRQESATRMFAAFGIIAMLVMLIGCHSKPSSSITTVNASSYGVQDQRQPQLEVQEMTQIETFEQLPENYDSRLSDILRQQIPDDVIVSFYYISAAKDYSPNYRWELHTDGRLFLIHHSGKNISFDVTFDRPLPVKPTKILTNDQIQALYSQLEQARFFQQPQFQKRLNVEGGSCVIVRVRRDNRFHEVVYENVESPLVEYLYSIAY